jgi:hypothetical protein
VPSCRDIGNLLSLSDVVPNSPDITRPAPGTRRKRVLIRDEAHRVVSEKFTVNAGSTYSLGELIDLAESQSGSAMIAANARHCTIVQANLLEGEGDWQIETA